MKKLKLIDWAKKNAPKALGTAIDIAGNITGIKALNVLSDAITGDNPDGLTPDQIEEALQLKEKDLEELELILADRSSARSREVELARAGRKYDPMMMLTGLTGLISYMVIVYAIIWIAEVKENPLFIHLMGMVEGVVLGSIFSYYFGSSKGSADKQDKIHDLFKSK